MASAENIAESRLAERVPPQAYFVVSAIFHYLGPAFAVMLFSAIAPLGVAWLRIASAAIVFAVWRRPWRYFRTLTVAERWAVVGLGVSLAAMNSFFYLAIDRLPLGTVGAMSFSARSVSPLSASGRRAISPPWWSPSPASRS